MDLDQLAERARVWLGLTDADTGADVEALPDAAAAAAEFVNGLPDTADLWDKRTEQGAVMLTARLVRRRNSPEGVAAFTAESAIYVARSDPDISWTLRLDRHKRPRIG